MRPAPARPWSSPRSGCCSAAGPTAAPSAPAPGPRGSRARAGRPLDGVRRGRSTRPAARSRTAAWSSAAPCRAEGRSRAYVGGASVPVAGSPSSPSPWSPCTASPTSTGCCRPRAQRDALDRSAATPWPRRWPLRAACYERAARRRARARRGVTARPRARPRGRPAAVRRSARSRRVDPQPGEDAELAAEEAPARARRRAARRRRAGPRGAVRRRATQPDALGAVAGARPALDGVRDHDPRPRAGRPAGRARLPARRPGGRRRVVRRRARDRPGPAGGGLRAPGRADRADPQVRRDRRRGAGLGASGPPTRLLDLDGTDERIEQLRGRARPAARPSSPRSPPTLDGRAPRRPPGSAGAVTDELAALAMPHAAARASRVRARRRRTASAAAVRLARPARRGRAAARRQRRRRAAAAAQGRLRRRAVPGDAGARGRAGRRPSPVPTFVFDEVDAGVGGAAAVEVGRRLARLARTAQVLVVTHLPQVAAFADRHVVVAKSGDGTVTSSGLTVLDDDGRERELSRMLAGLERLRHRAGARPRAARRRPGGTRARPLTRRAPRGYRSGEPAADSMWSWCQSATDPPSTCPGLNGTARVDRRTKLLLPRLRPGDIAVLDHLDLDRATAQALVDAGVAAVVNAAPMHLRPLPQPRAGAARRGRGRRARRSGRGRRPDPATARRLRIHDGDRLRRRGAGRARPRGRPRVGPRRDGRRPGPGSAPSSRRSPTTAPSSCAASRTCCCTGRAPRARRPGSRAGRSWSSSRPRPRAPSCDASGRSSASSEPVLVGVDGGADALLAAGLPPDVVVVGDRRPTAPSCRRRARRCAAPVTWWSAADARRPAARRPARAARRARRAGRDRGHHRGRRAAARRRRRARVIVGVGTHATLDEFLDRQRAGLASTYLTRLRVGHAAGRRLRRARALLRPAAAAAPAPGDAGRPASRSPSPSPSTPVGQDWSPSASLASGTTWSTWEGSRVTLVRRHLVGRRRGAVLALAVGVALGGGPLGREPRLPASRRPPGRQRGPGDRPRDRPAPTSRRPPPPRPSPTAGWTATASPC